MLMRVTRVKYQCCKITFHAWFRYPTFIATPIFASPVNGVIHVQTAQKNQNRYHPGSATDRDNNLEKIIAAGANVVRLNFSHGSPEDHQVRADKVREIAAKLGRHVAILGDLQGPKIRVSTFKEGKIFLNVGDKFLLDANLSKGEGDKEKSVSTIKACLPTWCRAMSCCSTTAAFS